MLFEATGKAVYYGRGKNRTLLKILRQIGPDNEARRFYFELFF